jgi:hypothetical protein
MLTGRGFTMCPEAKAKGVDPEPVKMGLWPLR